MSFRRQPEANDMQLVPTKHTEENNTPLKRQGQERDSEKAAKTGKEFNPCENSEKPL